MLMISRVRKTSTRMCNRYIVHELQHGVYIQKCQHISLPLLIYSMMIIDMLDFFGSANNATCILRRGFCTSVLFIVVVQANVYRLSV